jgi:DNA-binding MarR family transcriptional regulator
MYLRYFKGASMDVGEETGGENVSDLFQLMILMTRLSSRLSVLPQFKKAGLGLAEWSALMILRQYDGISNKDLAKRLGVSGQRANQIRSSLHNANLVAVSQSPDDNRKNVIRLTDLGRSRLSIVDQELEPLISAGRTSQPRAFARATRNLRFVMKLIHVKPERKLSTKAARPRKKKPSSVQETSVPGDKDS